MRRTKGQITKTKESDDGHMLVVSAPSGAGKGTVIGELLKINPELALSVSVTSRQPRHGEVDGLHYHFVSRDAFLGMIRRDEFVEWDEYQGNFYGTSKAKIALARSGGRDVIFDITIKGAFAIREHYPEAALVFLVPPSLKELERRLRGRGTESENMILGRLREARHELSLLNRFDYCVVNDIVSNAAEILNAILMADRAKLREPDEIIRRVTGDSEDGRQRNVNGGQGIDHTGH